jgi:hypothetical protein
MSLGILITIGAVGSTLIIYTLIERHVNQRACSYCGFRISAVADEAKCPRCGRLVVEDETSRPNTLQSTRKSPMPGGRPPEPGKSVIATSAAASNAVARGGLDEWRAGQRTRGSRGTGDARLAKIMLIGAPLLVMMVDAVVLIHRGHRSEADKAIALVQTSSSRIENFTVQQYLYATLFERKRLGDDIVIEGWRVWQEPGNRNSATVEFDFRSNGLLHNAAWGVSLSAETVTATTEDARNLSWAGF